MRFLQFVVGAGLGVGSARASLSVQNAKAECDPLVKQDASRFVEFDCDQQNVIFGFGGGTEVGSCRMRAPVVNRRLVDAIRKARTDELPVVDCSLPIDKVDKAAARPTFKLSEDRSVKKQITFTLKCFGSRNKLLAYYQIPISVENVVPLSPQAKFMESKTDKNAMADICLAVLEKEKEYERAVFSKRGEVYTTCANVPRDVEGSGAMFNWDCANKSVRVSLLDEGTKQPQCRFTFNDIDDDRLGLLSGSYQHIGPGISCLQGGEGSGPGEDIEPVVRKTDKDGSTFKLTCYSGSKGYLWFSRTGEIGSYDISETNEKFKAILKKPSWLESAWRAVSRSTDTQSVDPDMAKRMCQELRQDKMTFLANIQPPQPPKEAEQRDKRTDSFVDVPL